MAPSFLLLKHTCSTVSPTTTTRHKTRLKLSRLLPTPLVHLSCPYQCFLIWIYIFAIAFFVHSPTIVVSQRKLNQSYRQEKLIKNVVAKIKAKIERQGWQARDKCEVKEDDGCEHSTKWCVHCAQAAQLWVTALVTKLSQYDGHDLQGELKEHR